MTEETTLYVLVGFYTFFFLLFVRYFFWRREAVACHWSRRVPLTVAQVEELAHRQGRPVPFLSILVPARGEAVVIANTLRHLAGLPYPAGRLEIIVITDAKEERDFREGRSPGPTTQRVVEEVRAELARDPQAPTIKHLSVPCDFDGRLGGRQLGREVPSTKGRALNYGLGFLDPQSDICAFYDAESRPEEQVLLYVAYRYLSTRGAEQAWYGPVFQVRNFYQQGAISRLGALYQCVSHEWYIPVLMKKLPFVGGTNFFVTRRVLERVRGYDCTTLTEDVEIGVRLYLMTGHWPVYLPYWSTEQTPAGYPAFFRQRLRWGSGHLQVTEKFRRAYGFYPEERRQQMVRALFLKGEAEWLLYQGALVLTVAVGLAGALGGLDLGGGPPLGYLLLRVFTLGYFAFTYYLYFRYRRFMDPPRGRWARLAPLGVLGQILFLPVLSPFLLFPYSWALVLKAVRRQPQGWVKTPRTGEAGSRVSA